MRLRLQAYLRKIYALRLLGYGTSGTRSSFFGAAHGSPRTGVTRSLRRQVDEITLVTQDLIAVSRVSKGPRTCTIYPP